MSTLATMRTGFRVQRYHHALRVGHMLTADVQRSHPVELHLRQSSADSACALHAIAMAFIVLDLAKRSALLVMSTRKYGVAADLYELLGFSWHQGLFADAVVDALEALKLPITVRWTDGFDNGVDAFAVDALKRGTLCLIAYESFKDRHRHFILGVGCAGVMRGAVFEIDSLLVLDPSTDALPFSCCNGMLRIDKPVDFARRQTSVRWRYESAGDAEPVRLMSAISVVRHDGDVRKGRS